MRQQQRTSRAVIHPKKMAMFCSVTEQRKHEKTDENEAEQRNRPQKRPNEQELCASSNEYRLSLLPCPDLPWKSSCG